MKHHMLHVAAVRAAAAALRASPRGTPLPDDLRDAIRALVCAAAIHERFARIAPVYPEDAQTLDAMLGPVDVEAPQACEVGCDAECVQRAPELHGVNRDWRPS